MAALCCGHFPTCHGGEFNFVNAWFESVSGYHDQFTILTDVNRC
ncbi:MAG: hypothetical protein ACLUZZ_01160 [Alistipes inops]